MPDPLSAADIAEGRRLIEARPSDPVAAYEWLRKNGPALLDAAEKVAALEAQIDRVRQVHDPIDAMNLRYPGGRLTTVCSGCGTDDGNWQTYPCPTIRALDRRGASGE